MARGQLLFHLLPQRVLTRGGKCLFPRLLVLRNPLRKKVIKVPRSGVPETQDPIPLELPTKPIHAW
jgi:hypothetical protein